MMKKWKATALVGMFSILALPIPNAIADCGGCGHSHATKDIVDTAVGAGSFNTLVAAVKAAGLVDTLKSPGPFTVFAPTDEAFAKLPKGTVESLLANPEKLGEILKYHVVPGRVMAADVVKLTSAKTVLGQSVAIDKTQGVKINNAKVVKTDIDTSNGVIHVIDTVMLPANDIVEVARGAGSFKTLLAALEAAELTDALRGEGPFTVFAPTDEAFAKLPKGTVESLLKDIPKLKSILTYHVVQGKVRAAEVVKLSEALTLQGQEVQIDASNGVKVNSANVIKTDVMAENGIIHVIDAVLLPPPSDQVDAGSPGRALILEAIRRGVPMFNDGNHAACVAIYEVAAMGLMASSDRGIGANDRKHLNQALASVRQSHDATRNAWTLRHALDAVYQSASGNMQ